MRAHVIELPKIDNPERLIEFRKTYRSTAYFSGDIWVSSDNKLYLRNIELDK